MLNQLCDKVRRGGAIIIVDKVENSGGYLGTALARMSLAFKLKAGASPAQVLEKEVSLAGVQRPISYDEMPRDAKRWFQLGEFAGWIIER